ncbi:hypothetical protein BRC75_04810 [Halobacteriales archaeon QH_7_69_31]|nr:MAG: hypothetical protein BRC75_04810 [Halobacteriales archaeon QH_7_69_31]
MYFLYRSRLIGLEFLPQMLALLSGQFRGSTAAVIRREFADATVVPPLRPPRAHRLGLPLPVCGFAECISLVEILHEPEPPNHFRILHIPKCYI